MLQIIPPWSFRVKKVFTGEMEIIQDRRYMLYKSDSLFAELKISEIRDLADFLKTQDFVHL